MRTRQVNLETRFGVREEVRTEPDLGVGREQLFEEEFDRAFEVGHGDVLVHVQSFDLMERRAVRGVGIIAAEDAARHHDADRRLLLEHRADLHRRGVRPHDVTSEFRVRRQIDVQRVLNVARGMIGRRVQRVETMPFVLDLRAVLDGESHPTKNVDGPLEDLRERMEMADFVASPRQRGVDGRA